MVLLKLQQMPHPAVVPSVEDVAVVTSPAMNEVRHLQFPLQAVLPQEQAVRVLPYHYADFFSRSRS